MILKRSQAPAVRDVPAFINDVNALWPGSIGIVGSVVHIVHTEGQGIMEALDEIISDGYALLQRFRLRVANVVLHVGLHLPFIGGMRLAHIDGQKIRVILVVVVNPNDVAHLATERRSSKTSEYENERTRTSAFPEMKMARAIKRDELRVRRVAARFQGAAVHVRQRVAHKTVHVPRASRYVRQNANGRDEEHAERARQPFPGPAHSGVAG